jgi:hypothetical protein
MLAGYALSGIPALRARIAVLTSEESSCCQSHPTHSKNQGLHGQLLKSAMRSVEVDWSQRED